MCVRSCMRICVWERRLFKKNLKNHSMKNSLKDEYCFDYYMRKDSQTRLNIYIVYSHTARLLELLSIHSSIALMMCKTGEKFGHTFR